MPKGICYNASRQERRKCSLWHAKSPGGRNSGAFLFRCGKVAYSLGWLPPIYLRPAICRCSRRLHLPRQRVRKTKIYSWWHTPFLYLYRGGSVAHYTIVAEMPQAVTSPCASLSVPAEESKGWSATIFYLLYSLIGKPKLILQIKNKPLTFFHLHFQSRPRGSKLHYILGRIYARIYPLDIGCLSCYNMCSGYIASSLKCYHFRTCEGGKPPFNPPFQRAERLIM